MFTQTELLVIIAGVDMLEKSAYRKAAAKDVIDSVKVAYGQQAEVAVQVSNKAKQMFRDLGAKDGAGSGKK